MPIGMTRINTSPHILRTSPHTADTSPHTPHNKFRNRFPHPNFAPAITKKQWLQEFFLSTNQHSTQVLTRK